MRDRVGHFLCDMCLPNLFFEDEILRKRNFIINPSNIVGTKNHPKIKIRMGNPFIGPF